MIKVDRLIHTVDYSHQIKRMKLTMQKIKCTPKKETNRLNIITNYALFRGRKATSSEFFNWS
jgi:hypothetical protein